MTTQFYYLGGDVNKILNETSAKVSNYQYDADGGGIKTASQTTTVPNPYRDSGEYYDEESGLYYLKARYYSPEIARFIAEDPHMHATNMLYGDENKSFDLSYIVQSTNVHVYDMNNPILFTTLSGKDRAKTVSEKLVQDDKVPVISKTI